jgi:hypothetical protein
MRMTLLALAVGVFLVGPAKSVRADDILDDAKRQRKIAADKFEADVNAGLADAAKLAKTNPREAASSLGGWEVRIQTNPDLSEERRQELKDQIASRIRQYRQQAAGTSTTGGGFTGRDTRQRADEVEQKNAEMAQSRKQAAELFRQGKFEEGIKVNEQFDKKYRNYGDGPSPSSVGLSRSARAAGALREIREIRDERDVRYQRAFTNLVRSTIPIEGEVEFPPAEKWRKLTEMRTKSTLTDKEKNLLKVLSTPIKEMQLKDQPIGPVLEEIEKKYGISIDLDKRGLDQAQLTPESPVSINARGQTLRSVLKTMLGNAGLTFTIRQEGLRVTTPQLAAEDMVTRVYPIGDLLQTAGQTPNFYLNQLQALQSLNSLINTIQGMDPQSWESGGGKGTIIFDPSRMALIVKQSAEMQFKLQGWMK